MKPKQLFAIIAIVFLVGMYIASLILAFIQSEFASRMLMLTIVLNVLIPIMAYLYLMMAKVRKRGQEYKEENGSDK